MPSGNVDLEIQPGESTPILEITPRAQGQVISLASVTANQTLYAPDGTVAIATTEITDTVNDKIRAYFTPPQTASLDGGVYQWDITLDAPGLTPPHYQTLTYRLVVGASVTSYCTVADMVRLFTYEEVLALSQLNNPDAEVIDQAVVQAAIQQAEAEALSYVGPHIPSGEKPLILTYKIANMARYYLEINAPRDDSRLRYEDALSWCRAVARGQVSLGLQSDGEISQSAGGRARKAGRREHTVFSNGGYPI